MSQFLDRTLQPIENISYKEYIPNVEPVIFMHGLSSTKETWDESAHIIAHRTGAKVYSFDARNHGDSEWSEVHGYDVMAEDLRAFMDSMSIQKAVIVGHSMGGKTGMIFAFRYPERVRCLVVEDMTISPFSNRHIVQAYLEKLKEILTQIPSHLELSEAKQLVAGLLSGEQPSDPAARKWNGSDLPLKKSHDGKSFEWKLNLESLTNFIQKKAVNHVRPSDVYAGPVLVIYGTKSPFKVTDDKEIFLKHFPNTSYLPIEGGTHSLHREFPETFCDLICYFILEQNILQQIESK